MNETLTKKTLDAVVWIPVGATLGFFCVAVPAGLLTGGLPPTHTAPLFPAVGSAIENMAMVPTGIALFFLGSALGFLKDQIWWLLGISVVAVFPMCTLIEIAFFPNSHNLWPIEFAIVGVIDIPAFLGAFLGSRLKERMRGGNTFQDE